MKRRRKDSAKRKDSAESLLYKVVEISNVDEASLERTVNEWVQKGWALDGVQFAMRESSKRPSMAFVFFTRVGEATELARAPTAAPERRDAWERLRQLAEGGDEP